jgi:glycosyltransferase 2 family protein
MKMKVKTIAVNALKMLFVAGLLYWMIATGKIDIPQMVKSLQDPEILIPAVAVWVLGPVVLGTWRWWLLLRGAELECSFWAALKLQLVGFFFNTAMPGAVGGDIVKAIYIVKDQPKPSGKTSALLTVLLDRIIGLIGLFSTGAVAVLLNYSMLMANPMTANLVKALGLVFIGALVFLGFIFVPYAEGKDPFERLLKKPLPAFKTILGIYQALRKYRTRPGLLFGTIGISMGIQVMFLWFMGHLGTQLYGDQFNAALLPTVFPFGILVTALPIAPGGMGVGHAAFEKLFQLVGLPGGANLFNIYTLTQLAMNLLCFVPYLISFKKVSMEQLSEEVQEAVQEA